MRLTEELKQKINDYFESESEEEVYEILKGYGLKENTYTLDELKSESDKFRDYLLKFCSKNECSINVAFEHVTDDYYAYKSSGIETRINIF